MPDILLATLNAKYAHSAFGLRYLLANLGPLQARTQLREFTINDAPGAILEEIVAAAPKIVGLGVYIWNVVQTAQLIHLLKAVRPETVVILGGPEVSHETHEQSWLQTADYVITGEGEVAFAALCAMLLRGEAPDSRVISGTLADVSTMAMPYDLYDDEDIAHRVIYVEASRGCPFSCEFCLSALDVRVRRFDLQRLLNALKALLDRGALQFKFIDRTFNLHGPTAAAILQFFLDHIRPGLFVHFEMVPDRLPAALRALIVRFPPGVLQFEIGVQTLTPAVQARISRRQDHERLVDNFTFLREQTGVHLHADLIVGLPGETLQTLAHSFDGLLALRPQEIQVGILKRLRGTPIIRHTEAFAMVYSPYPPYELLCNSTLDFATMQRLKRFARTWERVANSGRFLRTAPRLWQDAAPFFAFLKFSDWLFDRVGHTHGMALDRLAELLLNYLVEVREQSAEAVREALLEDYHRGAQRRTPAFLATTERSPARRGVVALPPRQALHLT